MSSEITSVNVLVTGSNGFIGSQMVRKLDAAGLHVTATYRNRNDYNECFSSDVDFCQLDLCEATQLDRLPNSIDVIVHVAATLPVPGVSTMRLVLDNIVATKNIIDYALRIKVARFIYLSSISIHGVINEAEVNEKTSIVNPDIYGLTKLVGEHLLYETSKTLPCISLRLPGVLGFGAHHNWLSQLTTKIKNNDPIIIYNPDDFFNNAVHINDLGVFVLHLISLKWHGFQAMPLAAAGKITIRSAVECLIKKIGSSSTYSIQPENKKSFTIDSSYAIDRFSYCPMLIEPMLNYYAKEIKSKEEASDL